MTKTELKDFRRFKTVEEKVNFFKMLQLHDLENFIRDELGYSVKLKKIIYIDKKDSQVVMNLESNELKNQTGIMKQLYDSVKISTFGNIAIIDSVEPSVNCDAIFNKVVFPELSFLYHYKDGGRNGHTCITVKYDLNCNNWYFRSIKDCFKMNYAYDGTYKAYLEKEELERQVEIKEV